MYKKNAILSVYDKTGIEQFAQKLIQLGWTIFASGGTAKKLQEADIPVRDLAEIVGGGAILGHRVVTLARELHAGLLARDCPEDIQELEKLNIPWFDLAYCNFYPLAQEIRKVEATIESVVELTDVGGPTMIRSAAKSGRIAVCDPEDMKEVMEKLERNGDLTQEERQFLRGKAESAVTEYVFHSANFHSQGAFDGLLGRQTHQLAYAENRCQNPAFLYASLDNDDPLAMHRFEVVSGEPSYISIADGSTIIDVLRLIAESCRQSYNKIPYITVVGKHGNPCGTAIDWEFKKMAISKSLLGNPRAVMGGELVTNFPIDDELGQEIFAPPAEININRKNWGLDLILAPSFSPEVIALLGKREKRRLLANPALETPGWSDGWLHKPVIGGFLKQKYSPFVLTPNQVQEWVGEPLDRNNFETLIIAWAVAWRASSNTLALAKDRMLIGLGTGQQDRIECTRLAIERAVEAGHDPRGSLFASDGFFPFASSQSPKHPPNVYAELNILLNRVINMKSHDNSWRTLAGKATLLLRKIDNREGPELLADAGVRGGVVPADGQRLQEVKDFFRASGMLVAFLAPENRGFSKH